MTTQAVDPNLATIQALYEAFGRGDVPAILEFLDENIDWEYGWSQSPVPWLQPGHGREAAARFFGTLFEMLEVQSFSVNQVLAGEGLVVSLFNIDCIVRSTGKRLTEKDEPHIFWFNEAGKISRFRHAADTHQHWLALQP